MNRSDTIMEQAAEWLLRRHAGLDPAGERALCEWLAQDPEHGAAFDRVAKPWGALDAIAQDDDIALLRREALRPTVDTPASGPVAREHWPWAMAACLALIVGGGGAWWVLGGEGKVAVDLLETGKGQRRDFVLADGSAITLNADSRVEVALAKHRRSLVLARGQAYFRVAHDRSRPFVVSAGEREIVAVGTEFDVSRRARQMTVALTQGRVRVEPTGSFDAGEGLAVGGAELAVGQALTYDQASGRTLITSLDAAAVKGWREGLLYFDHLTLANAVADFNRYSTKPLRIADPALAGLMVSGVFKAEDAAGFVKALTLLYPVAAQTGSGEIVLTSSRR